MSLRLGRVTSTFVDEGVPLLNVQSDRAGVEPREVPILRPLSGVTFMPKEGDTVALDELDDGTEVAVGVLNRKQSVQPDHGDEEFSVTLDDNTQFSFEKDGSGNYNVSISCSGKVTIDSDDVTLGDGVENVVVDLETTSADGYLTSVTPVNSTNLKVD